MDARVTLGDNIEVAFTWQNGAEAVALDVLRYLAVGSGNGSRNPARVALREGRGGLDEEVAPLVTFRNGVKLGRAQDALWLIGGGIQARIDIENGLSTVWTGEVTGVGQARRWAACAVVLECVLILLRRHRVFDLHAAMVATRGQGLLIAAEADSGKSTLAFRLVQCGWHYLSDDTVLLQTDCEGEVTARGFRAHFSLDEDSKSIFPEVSQGRKAALLKEDKWTVDVEAIFPSQRLAACPPKVIIFPEIVEADESTLRPLPPAEALHRLINQSSKVRIDLPGAAAHFELLARLARERPAYQFHAGLDILKDTSRAHTLFEPLLDQAQRSG